MATNTQAPQRYDDSPEFDQEGAVVDAGDISTLALLNKSEIDQQIATAKRYPRSIKQFQNTAIEMATLDEQTAAECIYSLPRAGKAITGPSARLAEIVLQAWTNVRGGARIVSDEGDFVTAQGMFYDLQNNVALVYEVKRRIVDSRGARFKPDMIGVTANAACSIALRNAVLKGVPKALWRKVEEAARKTIVGDIKTLSTKRANALQQFQAFGVTADMIFRVLSVKGAEDIGIDELVQLAGMLTALKESEITVEEMFAPPAPDAHVAGKTESRLQTLKEKYTAAPEAAVGPPSPPLAVPPPVAAENPDADPPDDLRLEPEASASTAPAVPAPRTSRRSPHPSASAPGGEFAD